MTTGIGAVALPWLTLGWLLDYSRSYLRTTDDFAPESSTLDLTKTGPYGSIQLGQVSLGFVGALGSGSTSTRNGSAAAGGLARAGYDVQVATGGFEFAYDLKPLLDFPLSPQFGYQYARVSTDGFSETGSPFALTGASANSQVSQYWLGVVYRDEFELPASRLQVRAYGRFIQTSGDTDGAASVAFASNPSTPLTVRGPRIGESAAEFGIRLRVPVLIGNVQVAYDGRVGDGGDSHVFAARARLAF